MQKDCHSKECHDYLEDLMQTLEDLSLELEVDYNGKIMMIILSSGQEYALNFHEPTNQLWMSSPFSGAHHFIFVNKTWRSTRRPDTIGHILQQELGKALEQRVVLL